MAPFFTTPDVGAVAGDLSPGGEESLLFILGVPLLAQTEADRIYRFRFIPHISPYLPQNPNLLKFLTDIDDNN